MPIVEVTSPRYYIECDECQERIGSEDPGGWVLYRERDEAEHAAQMYAWRVDGDRITCVGCIEDEPESAATDRQIERWADGVDGVAGRLIRDPEWGTE